jgi:soluble epoxide hydrolase/lipid-phosphate phosphatase
MTVPISRQEFSAHERKTSFLTAGPKSGPLLIFMHGWPGIAETWKNQIETFASLGFYVVAPDTRGYGHSSVSKTVSDYSLEILVQDALALLSHLERKEAVWIGHDWGSGIVWSLAAHHPEVCKAVINLAVPYQMLEYGLDNLLTQVNRDIYPEDSLPYGQWDYQVYYEKHPDRVTKQYEANIPNSLKTCYVKANYSIYGKPARHSLITRDGGWFGGADAAPDTPLSATVFEDNPGLHKTVSDAMSRTGFFGATAYYLNHSLNEAYAQKSFNGGFLDMPCLFIAARHDPACAMELSRLTEPMRRYCRELTECTVNAAHWLQLEKPGDVNAAIARVCMFYLFPDIPYHIGVIIVFETHVLIITLSSGWEQKWKSGGLGTGQPHLCAGRRCTNPV